MKSERILIVLALSLSILAHTVSYSADDVTTEDVKKAIQAGTQYLRNAQRQDGSWPYPEGTYLPGATALAVYALLHVGVAPNDPAIQKGLDYVSRCPLRWTYNVSLSILAMTSANPEAYRPHIQRAAEWLLATQGKNGQWSYYHVPGQDVTPVGDNSNTQFAVLALREAARAGVPVSAATWRKISKFYRDDQLGDGGWGYAAHRGPSYGSMTAAGICGLAIASTTQPKEAHLCGHEPVDEDIERGIQWISDRFSVTANPGKDRYYYYYMYSVERVGVLTGKRIIGLHDWYREGAAQLVRRQQNGCWADNVPDTCFALLFLGKGGAPVIVNKLKWEGDWNNDPHDAENLTKFYSSVTKHVVSWEVVDIAARISVWMRAPILYFNGHRSPENFTDLEIQKLRDFVDEGGFLFAEACCGKAEFDKGFRLLAKKLYPDDELTRLDADHPIYSMRYNLTDDPPELWGINTGCRMSVIYSPKDLSCTWEMARWQNKAFKMGVNLLAYATGDEPLRGKLDKIVVAESGEPPKPPPRGALIIAQIRHGTDWNTDPLAMNKLMLHLQQNASFDVGTQRKVVILTDPDLFDYPILYMTTHGSIVLSKEEKDRLRTYLERGGFLFSDACCGSKVYDTSFRALMKELFPDAPLQRLPETHPIYSIGGKIDRVVYKSKVLAEEPTREKPALEGITLKGRTAVVYNRYDMTCAIHGHPCPNCRGIVAKDAFRLATSIVLYAMTY